MDAISGVLTLIFGVFDWVDDVLGAVERYRLLAWAAMIPATLFPILYAKWFPFWKSTLGRALMTKATGMALLVDTAVLYMLLPVDSDIKRIVGFVVGALVVVGMWWQLVAITKIRLADRAVYESAQIDDTNRSHEDFKDKHRL